MVKWVLEIQKPTNITSEQITEIENHLKLVLNKVTSNFIPNVQLKRTMDKEQLVKSNPSYMISCYDGINDMLAQNPQLKPFPENEAGMVKYNPSLEFGPPRSC